MSALSDPVPSPSAGSYHPGRAMLVVAWVAIAVVIVLTVVGGLPSSGGGRAAVVLLTVLATVLWLLMLGSDELKTPMLVGSLLGVGLAGAFLDLTRPDGPGCLLVFMSLSTMGLRLTRGTALIVGAPVLLAAGWAQAATSPHPVSAVLNIAVGAGFLVITSAYAAMNRDAHAHAALLLAQETATRQAREQAAGLAERARLARELHDVLAHCLSGLAVQLEGAKLLAEHTHADPRLVEQVGNAQRLVRDGIGSARATVETLRGDALPGPGQLPELVHQATRTTGRAVAYAVVGCVHPLAPESGLALYRTVQEALTNTAKYAGPGARAEVTLTWLPDAVRVDVVDSGGGCPDVEHHSGGLGLAGVAERAALAGGQLETGPTKDGWRVSLTLPAPARSSPVHDDLEPALSR
jgi:signal transduction histidine kinase